MVGDKSELCSSSATNTNYCVIESRVCFGLSVHSVVRCRSSWQVVMAESSLSRPRRGLQSRSLRNRVVDNVRGFLFFMTLWSAESTAAILHRQTRRTYKIKRGHVRYGNKWIPLHKFRRIQVFILAYCIAWLFPLFSLPVFLLFDGKFICCLGTGFFNVLHVSLKVLTMVMGFLGLASFILFFQILFCTNVTSVIFFNYHHGIAL